MKYVFNDILSEELYKAGLCVFVTGPYSIFNNIVADKFKGMAQSKEEMFIDDDLMAEFGIKDTDFAKVNTSVDIDTFRDVVGSANIHGKWYCKVAWDNLTKKQREYVQEYMKFPNANGYLIVVIEKYADYRFFLKSRLLANSKETHLIQLSFPNRKVLVELVAEMFRMQGAKVTEEAAELFVMRMSTAYDDYGNIITKVLEYNKDKVIDRKVMEVGLKGVENFVIDDFIEQLLKPLSGSDIQKNRKIYKMYGALVKEMGADGVLTKIKYKVDELIEFRRAINNGIIPIQVRFSVEEAKQRLGEESKLYKVPDFRFRKMAYIASQTSLKDWFYMQTLLSQVGGKYGRLRDTQEYERILYTLVHRTVLNEHRIKKGIGME